MKAAVHIPEAQGAKTNGATVKDHVMGTAAKLKEKLGPDTKPDPINLEADHSVGDPINFRQILTDMGFKVSDWKRTLLANIAAFLSGYVIGTTFNALFNYMFAASIVASGWTFVTIVAAVITFIAAVYCAAKAARKIGRYIIDGDIDADIASLRSKVGGWFGGRATAAA